MKHVPLAVDEVSYKLLVHPFRMLNVGFCFTHSVLNGALRFSDHTQGRTSMYLGSLWDQHQTDPYR